MKRPWKLTKFKITKSDCLRNVSKAIKNMLSLTELEISYNENYQKVDIPPEVLKNENLETVKLKSNLIT